MIKYNLYLLSKEERKKISTDLIAANVAFKEKNKIDVLAESIEMQQPKEIRSFFRERLSYYRNFKFKK